MSLLALMICLSKVGEGEVIPILPQPGVDDNRHIWPRALYLKPSPYSTDFQWLLYDVKLESESRCKITSYINNLHPRRHKGLYQVIEDIISCAIPFWGLTVAAVHGILRWKMPGRRIEYCEVD